MALREAVEHIYRQLRNAEPPDYETAKGVFEKLFFSDTRYDLGEVGRFRLNKKLGIDNSEESRVLTKSDIISIINFFIFFINFLESKETQNKSFFENENICELQNKSFLKMKTSVNYRTNLF